MEKMKRFLPFVMLMLTASAANAGGLVTKHAASVQLTVDAARSVATRTGSSSVFQVQILTPRMDQLPEQFPQVLSPLVYILQELLQQPKTLLEQHLVSVSLIHKLTQCLPVQQLLALFLTSDQLLHTQLAPKTHLLVL